MIFWSGFVMLLRVTPNYHTCNHEHEGEAGREGGGEGRVKNDLPLLVAKQQLEEVNKIGNQGKLQSVIKGENTKRVPNRSSSNAYSFHFL